MLALPQSPAIDFSTSLRDLLPGPAEEDAPKDLLDAAISAAALPILDGLDSIDDDGMFQIEDDLPIKAQEHPLESLGSMTATEKINYLLRDSADHPSAIEDRSSEGRPAPGEPEKVADSSSESDSSESSDSSSDEDSASENDPAEKKGKPADKSTVEMEDSEDERSVALDHSESEQENDYVVDRQGKMKMKRGRKKKSDELCEDFFAGFEESSILFWADKMFESLSLSMAKSKLRDVSKFFVKKSVKLLSKDEVIALIPRMIHPEKFVDSCHFFDLLYSYAKRSFDWCDLRSAPVEAFLLAMKKMLAFWQETLFVIPAYYGKGCDVPGCNKLKHGMRDLKNAAHRNAQIAKINCRCKKVLEPMESCQCLFEDINLPELRKIGNQNDLDFLRRISLPTKKPGRTRKIAPEMPRVKAAEIRKEKSSMEKARGKPLRIADIKDSYLAAENLEERNKLANMKVPAIRYGVRNFYECFEASKLKNFLINHSKFFKNYAAATPKNAAVLKEMIKRMSDKAAKMKLDIDKWMKDFEAGKKVKRTIYEYSMHCIKFAMYSQNKEFQSTLLKDQLEFEEDALDGRVDNAAVEQCYRMYSRVFQIATMADGLISNHVRFRVIMLVFNSLHAEGIKVRYFDSLFFLEIWLLIYLDYWD